MARFASDLLTSDNLIGPNKDRDNFGLLKARDLIRTIMGRGPFGLLPAHELFGTFQAQPTSQPPKSPLSFLAKSGPGVTRPIKGPNLLVGQFTFGLLTDQDDGAHDADHT